MSTAPRSLLFCFVFAIFLAPAVRAQPPAPMPANAQPPAGVSGLYPQGDDSSGRGIIEKKDTTGSTTWIDQPAMTLVPRWRAISPMFNGPQAGVQVPVFSNTEYGSPVTMGDENAPSAGYPHQIAPPANYGLWYRPEGYANRIYWNQPYSFNPRGYGVPQHRTPYRLDYAPHVLSTTQTQYGPYYYPRFRDAHDPLPPCDKDCCYSPFCRKRSFWLLDR